MLVSGSDSKELLSAKYYWTKVRMASCQVMKNKQWISTPKKLTMIAASKRTSLYTTVWYRAMKFITHLGYVCIWMPSGHCGFILWEYHTCPLFSGGLQSHFTIFLVS